MYRDQQGIIGSYKRLHKAFGFILAMLTPFVGFKYQGSLANIVGENYIAFHLFLLDAFIYAMAILMVALENPNPSSLRSFKYTFLSCGIIACELILFVLVTQFAWFAVINAAGVTFYIIFCISSLICDEDSCYGRTLAILTSLCSKKTLHDHEQSGQDGNLQMIDIMPNTSSIENV